MTAGQTCALPGCNKPPFPSPDSTSPHLACGNLHHLLLMAGRFNPTLPHPHQPILDRNAAGLCALPSCHDPPHPGHSWCSRTHYLRWLSDFMSSLLLDQICKLFPACTRHVFVEEDGSSSQFCGWHHQQKYVMVLAMQDHHRQPTQQQSLPSSPSFFAESKYGHVPSVDSLVHCLREYAHFAKAPPEYVKVDDDFFKKHPWDVCTEDQTAFLIVRCKYGRKGNRVLLTKDNYRWKQQGRGMRNKNSDFTVKYFTYSRRKGKRSDVGQHHDRSVYHMDEYTIEGIKDFSLIKLHKGTDGPRRHRKGRPADEGNHSQANITDTRSQSNLLPTSDDEMSEDSFFRKLSPLDDRDYDIEHNLSLVTADY